MSDRAKHAQSQWQNELPNLDTEAMVVFGRLGELYQLVTNHVLNPNFTRFGLQPGEFDVLATLRRSGKPFALPPTQLYQAAMISSGSMTNRIDRLCAAGLVERLPNPKDKRGTLVKLTEQGKSIIEQAIVPHIENQTKLLESLDGEERQQLASYLLKLINRVEQGCEENCQ